MEMRYDRSIYLMNTPHDYDKYVFLKIKPIGGGCCCLHWTRASP